MTGRGEAGQGGVGGGTLDDTRAVGVLIARDPDTYAGIGRHSENH